MINRLLPISAGVLAALVFASPANAVLQFSLDINGATLTCVDNTACDTNPAVGTLQTGATTFAGVSFLGSSQTQTVGAINSLNTTSFQITNNNAGAITYTLAVGGTNFVGPVTTLSQSGSGTFQNAVGSTINLTYYADTANTQGADTPTDLPGVQQANSGTITATLLTDSFNFNHTSAFADPNLYSMTLGTTGTLTSGGSLVGRSQAEIAVAVPEPASMGILGGGLLALGAFNWFRRRRHNHSDVAAA
jgi:hypothetical protein